MPRYKITIEYDGTGVSGWQRQVNGNSIQQFLEEAIAKFSKEQVTVHGSGRTDAGVHAFAQVAHFDLELEHHPHIIQRTINHFLKPNKVIITECEIVDVEFHARFSAKRRLYQYVVLNRLVPSVLLENRAWHVRENLDVNKMQEAANLLLGLHDFTSFRATHCQALSPIKTVDEIKISQEDDKIFFNLKAPSFLHHMVRNIVGTLVLVGKGKWKVEDVARALAAKDRKASGPTAPAQGLYFVKVQYD